MTDWRSFFDVLVRRWQVVVGLTALALLAALGGTMATRPSYEATAVIALAPATLSIPTANQVPPYYLMVDSTHQLPIAYTPAYYVALLESAEVTAKVAATVPVNIAPSSADKSLLEITARAADPNLAAQTANKWAQVGADRIQQLLMPSADQVKAAQSKLDVADQALAKFSQDNSFGEYDLTKLRSATGLSPAKKSDLDALLRARDTAESVYIDFETDYERSTILMSSTYKPNVVNGSVPSSPVSPKPVQNLLVGGGLGLLVGVLGAFALELLVRK